MGVPRQDYWSRLPFPSPEDLFFPGDLPDLAGIEPTSLASQATSLPLRHLGSPCELGLLFPCVGKE